VAPDKLTCAAGLTAVELTSTKPFTPGMVPSSPEIERLAHGARKARGLDDLDPSAIER
jgi:hypothetical protein